MNEKNLEALLAANPAPRVVNDTPKDWKPALEFDGTEGFATLPPSDGVPNFDDFLTEQGFDPAEFEIVGDPRTSRWQRYDGSWLTSYRFRFRRKMASIDLPLLLAQAKKTKATTPASGNPDKALVVLWSDLQIGKVASRGGTPELLERVFETQARLIAKIKAEKPSKVIFADLGDTVENFSNAADLAQLQSNDLSLMEQVDLAATLAWDYLKAICKLVPDVSYVSVGSNHCQFRVNKARVGRPSDDWGIYIGRTLARLSREVGLGIKFYEPHEQDESLALDVFGDDFHILGVFHGHQAKRPEAVPTWLKNQMFGNQAITRFTTAISGHFHHLIVKELGSTNRGTSRFWVQASTMDSGSDWFRLTSGEDSQPGLVVFTLERGIDFTGTVFKL